MRNDFFWFDAFFTAQAFIYSSFQIFEPLNTLPGAMQLTRIFADPNSKAQPRAMCNSPALVAL